MSPPQPSWVRPKKLSKQFEVIPVKKWDDYKDFKIDKGAYLLIRIYRDRHEIGVAICDYKHTILKEFQGRRAQDLYTGIFDYQEKYNLGWFTRLDHAAYLGKELKKAEISLVLGTEYYQE